MRNQTVTYSTAAVFQALADPTRRALLDRLRRQGSQAAGELALAFPVSRPAISRHLRLLRRARLVEERRQGRHRFYRVNPQPLQAVDRWLEEYRAYWSGKLAGLKAFVESQGEQRRGEEEGKRQSTRTKERS